jgi:esterase/lipase
MAKALAQRLRKSRKKFMIDVTFSSEGQKIDGSLILPSITKEKLPAVIFFHGMTSSKEKYVPIAETIAKEGIVGLALSLRGHGKSEGNFNKLTVSDLVNDGLTAYDFLISQPNIDEKRIGICGVSVGAAVASLVCAQRNVKSLAMRVPATYSDELMNMTLSQLMVNEEKIFKNMRDVSNTPAVKAISNFSGSLLVITSENDHIIPAEISDGYYLKAKRVRKKEKFEIKGATHNLTNENWKKQFTEEIIRWFKQTL